MLRKRIIPILLIHNGGLYKTEKFRLKSARYIGDPINAIKIFNEKEVDELVILDVDCSKNKLSPPNLKLIERMVSECFMPIAYGGGINNVDKARDIINVGVEKVVLNSHVLNDLDLISRTADLFGSQSVVVSVDVKRSLFGKLRIFDSSRGKNSNWDFQEYLLNIQSMGAGEILITSVDREGTFLGYDWDLLRELKGKIEVPCIINGGASDVSDFIRADMEYGYNSFAASSLFVYKGSKRGILITYPNYDQVFK